MDVEPAASMRCWAIDITLGERMYEVPAQPAADWWPVLSSGDPGRVLDMIPSSSDLDDDLIDGKVTGADLREAVVDAIEEVAGRSFHAAFVLATAAQYNWSTINGKMARSGFRWDVMPLGAALDAVYSIIVDGLADEDRKKFLALLENETLTGGKPRRRNRERVQAEFEQFAGPKPTSGARSSGARSGSERPRTRRLPRPHLPDDRSPAPTPLPGSPGRSGPPARTGSRVGAVEPASGIAPPPPLGERRPRRSRSAGPGSGRAPSM